MRTKTRLWVLVTGLLCGLVVLYGVLMGLLPQLAAASQTRVEASSARLINDAQHTQLAVLQEADRDADQLAENLTELELAIPTGGGWTEFLRELQEIQAATGAVVTGVTVQPNVPPTPEADPAAAADSAAATEPADGEAAATASTNLVQVPVALTVTGTTEQVAEFLRQVQIGKRLFVVTNVEISDTSEATTGTATGSIYVAP